MFVWIFSSLLILAQPSPLPMAADTDHARLIILLDQMDSSDKVMICTPWASAPRLKSISVDNCSVSNLLRYENLWLALYEDCLKNAQGSQTIEVVLNRKGKLIRFKQNGVDIDLKEKHVLKTHWPACRRGKFKELADNAGKVIKITINIG